MPKTLRRLFLIPVLAFAFAILAGFPQTRSAAAQDTCVVDYHPCPEPSYDCCCGHRATCTNSAWECEQFCNSRW